MISQKGFTEALQESRVMVVGVNGSQVVLKGSDDVCSTLSCHEQTVVAAEEGESHDLRQLLPGDIVKVESTAGRPERIVVLRRVWEELTSQEM